MAVVKNARRFRHRITLEEVQETKNAQGECIISGYGNELCLAADVKVSDYSQTLQSGNINYTGVYEIVTRYDCRVTLNPRSYRLKLDGKVLKVHSMINADLENKFIKIKAYDSL